MTAQQLKNSILQMAVQGKLVPQDPNDEPASVLLERIRTEKERLIKEKKIKREKNPSVIFKGADNTPYEKIGDEVRSLADLAPFEIPSSWEWCRVGDLFSNMSGLAYKKDTLAIMADKMIRILRGGNIGEEEFYFKGDDAFISSELVKPELYLRKNYMITPAVSSLDHIGKLLVHALRKLEAVESIHNKGYAALSGLTVDTDDRLVLSSDIAWIDRQIRNFPVLAVSFVESLHTFVDGIMMGTGECGKYQLAGIRMSRMDRDLAASFVNTDNIVDMSDFQLRVDALGEHVVGDI